MAGLPAGIGPGVQSTFLLARHRGFPLANCVGCTPGPMTDPIDPTAAYDLGSGVVVRAALLGTLLSAARPVARELP